MSTEALLTSLSGRYAIGPRIGRGGAGEVHRAHDAVAGRDVAIKVLLERSGTAHLERFRREAELTAALRHPGIVAVHGAGEVGGGSGLHRLRADRGRTRR